MNADLTQKMITDMRELDQLTDPLNGDKFLPRILEIIENIKSYVDQGADPNVIYKQYDGMTEGDPCIERLLFLDTSYFKNILPHFINAPVKFKPSKNLLSLVIGYTRDAKIVETLIEACNLNVNDKNYDDKSAVFSLHAIEVIETLLRHGVDINARDRDGQTVLFSPFLSKNPAIKKMKRFIPHGADVTILDHERQSILLSFNWTNDEFNDFSDYLYKNGKFKENNITKDNYHTRLQTILLRNACGTTGSLHEKDPITWTNKYQILNTITDHEGQVHGHRSMLTTARHTTDFLNTISKHTLLPALIHRYPEFAEKWGQGYNDKLKNTLSYMMADVLFNAYNPHNIPAVAAPKIIEVLNRWDINAAHIRHHCTDHTQNEKAEKFKEEKWTRLSPAVQAPNGLWLVPLTNAKALTKEANELKHCVEDYLSDCTAENIYVVGVRRKKNKPEFTAAVKPNSKETSYEQHTAPLGYKNNSCDLDVNDAWNWYQNELNQGRWGTPDTKLKASKSKRDILNRGDNSLVHYVGFDPQGEEGFAFACKAWTVWADAMGDLLRYRKLTLPQIIDTQNLNKVFDKMAEKYEIPVIEDKKPTPVASLKM